MKKKLKQKMIISDVRKCEFMLTQMLPYLLTLRVDEEMSLKMSFRLNSSKANEFLSTIH